MPRVSITLGNNVENRDRYPPEKPLKVIKLYGNNGMANTPKEPEKPYYYEDGFVKVNTYV
jgi:hypothetical protein